MNALSKRTIRKGCKVRVLVVDDSVVIRRLVTHALGEDPSIEVVGTASNGAIALERIEQVAPDLITLDIEMPELDGIETLRRLRQENSTRNLRVIMFSTLTSRGAAATFEALSAGADDYVNKASNEGSLERSMANLRNELIPKIKQFFSFEESQTTQKLTPAVSSTQRITPNIVRTTAIAPEVVVLGISTGGPNALGAIMPMFPADFPLPILIVQHMPPIFTRLLAERLAKVSKLRVEEAVDGIAIEPGKVLLAPGDYHMRVHRSALNTVVKLDQGPPENSCRPAVDVLFRSAEECFGSNVIAAVLTGMGFDGQRGAETLKTRGAYLIAQDEATSVVWGMPGAVTKAGLADAVLPLNEIVPEIVRLSSRRRLFSESAAVRRN